MARLSLNDANYPLTPASFENLPHPQSALIILQLEIPRDTVCQIIRLRPVLLNPAPAPPGGLPKDIYTSLTHLIPNEPEARILRLGLHSEGAEEAAEEKKNAAAENDNSEPENSAKTAQIVFD